MEHLSAQFGAAPEIREHSGVHFRVVLAAAISLISLSCSGDTNSDADAYQSAALAATGLDGFRQDLAAAEEAKRACMAELGFDYEPAIAPEGDQFENLPAALLLDGPNSVPNGYGAVAFYQRAVAVATTGTNLHQLREEMPPEQFEAYIRALTGPDGSGGCEARAAEAAPMRGVRASFIEAAAEMHDAVLADPRWVAATEEWSECMANAGYQFADMESARMHVGRRLEQELGSASEVGGDPERLATLATILEEERQIARQDALCQQEQKDVLQHVWDEYAAEFARDHTDLVSVLGGS